MIFLKENKHFVKRILSLLLISFLFWTLQFPCLAIEEKVVKIGIFAPLTGLTAADGIESKRGAELAVKEINNSGGVNGYKFEVLVADTKDRTPDQVLSAVYNLVNSNVDCLISSSGGGSHFEIRDIAEKNIPYLLTDIPSEIEKIIKPSPEKFPTIWSLAPNFNAYGTDPPRIMEKWITEGKFDPAERKFAIITNDSAYSLDISERMKKVLEGFGWTCIMYETVPTTDIHDWRPLLAKLKAYKPNFILNADYVVGNAANFVKQFNEDPFNSLIFIQYAPVLQEFIDLTKEYSTGILYSLIGGPIYSPKAEKTIEFSKKYEEEYGEKPTGAYNVYIYEGVHVYADALRKVGNPKEYLEIGKAIGETDKDTVMGRLKFDKETHLALQGDEFIPIQLYQIWKGERNLLFIEKFATADFQLPPWFK
jgi:branched-chain amino acid transport system substrate-binding protein